MTYSLLFGLALTSFTVTYATCQILYDRYLDKQARDEARRRMCRRIVDDIMDRNFTRDASGQIRRVVRPDPAEVRRDVAERMQDYGYRI